MKNIKLKRQKEQLDDLFKTVDQLRKSGNQLEAHLTRYLCILVCGFLENAVSAIFTDYVMGKKTSPYIEKYIENSLRRFQNPALKKILELAGKFNNTWQTNLTLATQGDIEDALKSLINARNSIAHGGTNAITYYTLFDCYNRVIELIDLLEKELEKPK